MKNPFVRGLSSSYLGNWFALLELDIVVVLLSAGPSLYGGGGLSPASGTVVSFNEQLHDVMKQKK